MKRKKILRGCATVAASLWLTLCAGTLFGDENVPMTFSGWAAWKLAALAGLAAGAAAVRTLYRRGLLWTFEPKEDEP